jgi:hypothetical protein
MNVGIEESHGRFVLLQPCTREQVSPLAAVFEFEFLEIEDSYLRGTPIARKLWQDSWLAGYSRLITQV